MNGLQKKFAIAVVILIGVLIADTRVFAQSFLFPGVEPTTEAGLSQTNTRGATAVMTNPANIGGIPLPRRKQKQKGKLLTRGFEVYADVSMVSVNYSYTRSGYDPAVISTTVPPVVLGASWRPMPQFALGIEFVPRPALSPQLIKNLTSEQNGDIAVVDATVKQGSVLTGFGISGKVSPFVTLGLSLMETAEDNSFVAIETTSSSDTPLIQMSYKGSFIQAILGARITPNNLGVIGVSYKTAVVKNYSGSISKSGTEGEPIAKQGYLPAVLAVGGEYRMGEPVIFGEIRHEFWSGGAATLKSGLPSAPTSTALQDTNIFIVGGRYRWEGGHAASAAFGKYPPNVQYGSPLDGNGKAESDASGGVEFGDFDALDRYVFAGGYRYAMPRGFLQAGMNIQQGSRSVPPGYRNAGEYSLSVFTLTAGIGRDF